MLITNYHQQVLRNITLHRNLLDSLNSLLLQEKLKYSSMNLHYWTRVLVQCMLFFVYCERRTSNHKEVNFLHNQLLNIESDRVISLTILCIHILLIVIN